MSKRAFLERFRLDPAWRAELAGEPGAPVKDRNVLVRLSSLAAPVVAVTETEFLRKARELVEAAAPRLAGVRCAIPVIVRVGGLVLAQPGRPRSVSYVAALSNVLRGRREDQPIEAGS